ncbi:MAG: DUF2752 domain-containing protein [Nitrospirae bacterium]|nr:DUF2752 domain-containing protein [Nitrospirota bacterium]
MLRTVFLSILIVAALIVAAATLYMYDPSLNGFYPKCLFYQLTGLYCPGCGSTRALHQLLHGNYTAAFRLNPLTVLALPFLAIGIALEIRVFPRPPWLSHQYVRYTWIVPVVIVLFWILRNIPIEPFTYLMPK